jgi:hypothetical protein
VKRNLLAIALFMPLLLSAVVLAQTTQPKVTVPFDFIAGDTALPAGDTMFTPSMPGEGKLFQFTV